MSGFDGYDQWKTASPYDDFPDDQCFCCMVKLSDESNEYTDNGYCCKECMKDKEDAKCSIPVIRPLYNLLCAELGTPQSISSKNGKTTTERWPAKDFEEYWSRRVYKGTTCGAWLVVEDIDQIALGSIVEGVDYGTATYYLTWPFTSADFGDALDKIETEARDIWNDTHGCKDCYPEQNEGLDGMIVNPDCKTCKGHGVIK